MNPTPHLHGSELSNPGCGRMALENHAIAFWQSRMTVAGRRAEPPALVDLEALARAVRAEVRA